MDTNYQPGKDVICLENTAFWHLLEEVVATVKRMNGHPDEHRWINAEEAKQLLQLRSPTSLQKLRDEGKIAFTQPQHKVILYDRYSIYEYLNKYARQTF